MTTNFPIDERETNGRWPLRPCPGDFSEVYVKVGRRACEEWYGAGFRAINRWLEECGKERLIALRAAFVLNRIKDARRRRTVADVARILAQAIPVRDKRVISFTVARHAAHYLRVVRNGGFVVSKASNGDWRVGTRRMSAAQMVDFAVTKGFDRSTANLTAGGEGDVGCGR